MKILLTGASEKSFIGRHLHKYLTELGYETDTISKGEFMNEDWDRLDNFQLNTEEEVTAYGDVLPKHKPDVVVHCAWIRDDLEATDHLEFAEMSCNMFNECQKRGIRVINIGSSSEYGMKLEPMQEDMNCTPHTTYGIAKLMVTLYAKKLGYNTLRLFAVTGEGGHSFADAYKKSEKWGHPNDNRHFVPVRQVCKAVERLMHAQHIYGEIINVADQHGSYEEVVGSTEQDKWMKYPQRQFEGYMWKADKGKMIRLLNL